MGGSRKKIDGYITHLDPIKATKLPEDTMPFTEKKKLINIMIIIPSAFVYELEALFVVATSYTTTQKNMVIISCSP